MVFFSDSKFKQVFVFIKWILSFNSDRQISSRLAFYSNSVFLSNCFPVLSVHKTLVSFSRWKPSAK